jgi:tetratricopeptide (TPR) repeat protein
METVYNDAAEVCVRRSLAFGIVGVLFLLGVASVGHAAGGDRASVEALALVAQAQLRLASGELAEGLKLLRQAVKLDPESADLAEEFGLALADAGNVDEAIPQLRRASSLSPNGEATLGVLLATAAQKRAEIEEAVTHLQRGVDAVPQGPQVRVMLAQTLLRLGRGAEAWQQLQVLLGDSPDDPRLFIPAGEALRQLGKVEEAMEYFRRAAAIAELRPRATLELVDTLAAAGKFKEAADLLGGFLKKEGATLAGLTRWATLLARAGERERAQEVLDEVLAKDPSMREALLLKAVMFATKGDLDGAEQVYRRALAAHPGDAGATMGLARVLVEGRRFEAARTLLDDLWKQAVEQKVEGQPEGVEIAEERAAIEVMDRKPETALQWLKRLPNPSLARRALALWGEYFRQREAWSEGVAFFGQAKIEADPDTARTLAGLQAEFAFAAGDATSGWQRIDTLLAGSEDDVEAGLATLERRRLYKETVARARQALIRLPESATVQFALAAALERSGSWDEAEKEFRKLVAKHADNAAALNYLGYMFADHGVHLDEARELVTKAVSLEPASGAYQDSLGWVYFRLGDLDLAEKHLIIAVRLEPFDMTVLEHLGDLYKARGDKVKAADAYRRALANKTEEEGQKERIEKKLVEVAGGVP